MHRQHAGERLGKQAAAGIAVHRFAHQVAGDTGDQWVALAFHGKQTHASRVEVERLARDLVQIFRLQSHDGE